MNKRQISRWLILAACLVLLAVVLPGCGKKDQGGARGAGGARGGETEIIFWHSYVQHTEPAVKKLIARFEEEHPGIKVRAQYVQTGDVMLQKLTTALMTKTTPDVCWVRTNWIQPLVEEDAIWDVYELAEKYGGFAKEEEADFFPSLIESSYYKGELRVLPIQATCMTLAYNKDLFKKAGLNPNDPPDNWDEFIDYAQKLTIRDGDEVEQWGFHIPVYTGQLANYGTWQWKIFLWGWGGRYADPSGKKVTFNSQAGVDALQFWADLRNKYKVGEMTVPEQGFESQRIAMMLDGCWRIPFFPEIPFDLGLAPMPAGPAERIFPVDGEYMVIFKGSKNPEAAWTFATWFASPEIQEFWSAEAKYLPVRKSAWESESYQEYLKTDPYLKAFADQMEYAYGEPVPFKQGIEIDLLLADAIEEAVRELKTPKEALDEAALEANQILAEARVEEGAQ